MVKSYKTIDRILNNILSLSSVLCIECFSLLAPFTPFVTTLPLYSNILGPHASAASTTNNIVYMQCGLKALRS